MTVPTIRTGNSTHRASHGVRAIPQITGARGVAKRIVWHWNDRDATRLRQLADSASIAIQNAQLRGAAFHPTEADAAALRATLRAQSILQSVTVGRQLPPTEGCHLSPREREIITLVASGNTFKEVASILGISDRTVEHYLERLKQRFHQPRLAALVGHVRTHGVGHLSQ